MLYFARLSWLWLRLLFFFLLAATIWAAPAQAQEVLPSDPPADSTPRRRRHEISIYTGVSLNRPSDLRIMQPSTGTDATFENVHWRGHPFQGSRYYGYRLMTYLPKQPRLGIGLDFVHYKVYARVGQDRRVVGTWLGEPIDTVAPMSDRVQEFRITNGVNVFTLDILYRFPQGRSDTFPDGRLQPYVGGGPSYYVLFPINRVNNESNQQRGYRVSGYGYTLQAGVRYGITSRTAVFVETRYNRGDAKVEIANGGKADTDLRTTHIQGGLSVDF